MCGLILAPNHYPTSKVENAMMAMGYRGKDRMKGLTEGFGWKLGHVRLAIQDLSDNGRQPFISKSGMTAFVGELFNHEGRGERAFLETMIETEDFHNADGFWSVVHATAGGVKVFTDHLGIKPLYWWAEKGIVCSELFPMFQLEHMPALDEAYLGNCIKFGYDYSGRTPFVGIQQIPPGTVLTLDRSDLSSSARSYWDWGKVIGHPEDLRDTLDSAILNRTISDRPVAMLLSGGLDSSIIYYSLKDFGYNVQAFSVENGESEFLPEGVSLINLTDVHLNRAVDVMQAPLDLGSLVPQLQLAYAVKAKGYNVVLTGDGADELFGGYRRAADYDSQFSDTFCELPYYHLPRLDRVMMYCTIELRSPFLAPKVVATALRTRRELRTAKQALKHAYRDIVPHSILSRVKHPLKTSAVIHGGQEYRQELVKEFRNVTQNI